VDAHRDGKRFIVRADEMLTAFVELQRAIHEFEVSLVLQWPCRNGADEKLTAFLELEPAIRACRDTTVFKAGRALRTKIIEIMIDIETVCYPSSEAAR
jgi:hypothetical protein